MGISGLADDMWRQEVGKHLSVGSPYIWISTFALGSLVLFVWPPGIRVISCIQVNKVVTQ
jgi:hypothetical protein